MRYQDSPCSNSGINRLNMIPQVKNGFGPFSGRHQTTEAREDKTRSRDRVGTCREISRDVPSGIGSMARIFKPPADTLTVRVQHNPLSGRR